MKFASRVDRVPPYLFVQISRKIAEKREQGIDVVSFGIGDPDIPTPDDFISALKQEVVDPSSHRYPESDGLPEFREAVADWYQRRFGVSLNPQNEVLSLIGAKEGIGHVALCFLDPGDVALVPDPGYPVYSVGTLFAGGQSHLMPLLEENAWLPDLDLISDSVAHKAKMMWLNYPNNPTAATAEIDYFDKVVTFAKRHEIAVMHDACYTEVAYEGYRPASFLQAGGAKDVGVEFHSLSKTYNMTGWRLGMVVGNSQIIERLMIVKSNLDSGVPQAIQRMGIEAMRCPLNSVDGRNAIYQRRRDKIVGVLRDIGLNVELSQASLYIWAHVPEGYTSAEFSERLLEERDVLVSPGSGYGEYGEGYIRLSLTVPDNDLTKALDRISTWKIPSPQLPRRVG